MKHQSLYQILGLTPESTTMEIKQAYYHLISIHSPEKEPDKFMVIRSAYETLVDPEARQSYDTLRRESGDAVCCVDELEALKFQKDWPAAIEKARQILTMFPDNAMVKNTLGLCYLNNKQYDDARHLFETLVKASPATAAYWSNYGQCLKLKAETLPDTDSRKAQIFETSRGYFKKAIDLKPEESHPHLAISDTYLDEQNFEAATLWANNAISADGKVDFGDFDAMFQLAKIALYSDNLSEIDAVITRILEVVPDDKDYNRYVSARFDIIGGQLLAINQFDAAIRFFKGAVKFKPDNTKFKENLKQAEFGARAVEEYKRFARDAEIVKPLKKMGAIDLSRFLKQPVPNEEEVMEEINSLLPFISKQSLTSSIETLKSRYLSIYKLNASFYDKLDFEARQRSEDLTLS